jgi:hypothetical protein
MRKEQCPAGHWYNADKYARCPICNKDVRSGTGATSSATFIRAEEQPVMASQASASKARFAANQASATNAFDEITESIYERTQPVSAQPVSAQPVSAQPTPGPTPTPTPMPAMPPSVADLPTEYIGAFADTAFPVNTALPADTAFPVDTAYPAPSTPPFSAGVAHPGPSVSPRAADTIPVTDTAPPVAQASSLQAAVNAVVAHKDVEEIKTIAFFSAPEGTQPVVGWLVSIKGEYLGKSFALKAGNNAIGRAMNMDVPLPQEPTVSRNKHCTITYEPHEQVFFIQQGESSGLTYLNGELVMAPVRLQPYDRVALGATAFLFIPFAIEGFHWEDQSHAR